MDQKPQCDDIARPATGKDIKFMCVKPTVATNGDS